MEWDAKHLRLASDAAGVAFWSWNVDTDRLTLDEHGHDLWGIPLLWGVPMAVNVSFRELSARVHPADLDRVRAAFSATRAVLGRFEIDFRVLVEDKVRWIAVRGQGDEAELADRIMFGIFLDVTERKQAEAGNELLAGEMTHRVKNLLAVTSSLIAITLQSTDTTTDMARELTQRLEALGRAHDLIRPVPGQKANTAFLSDLFTKLLAPYDDVGASSDRIRVSVPPMDVGEVAATTLALVVHELATNSLKYGALSTEAGTLDVSCEIPDDDVVVVWTERGGPALTTPTGWKGYGSELMSQTMSYQLGGSLDYNWEEAGVVVTLRMNKEALLA